MRRRGAVDRLVAGVAGVAALGGGVALVAWWGGVLPAGFGDRVDASRVAVGDGPVWLAWSLLAGAALALLLVLVWALMHAPVPRRTSVRLNGSAPTGMLRLDLDSLAAAVGAAVEEQGDLESVRTSAITHRGALVVRAQGELGEGADPRELESLVLTLAADLARCLPEESVHLQVVVDPPGRSARRRARRAGRDRVRLPATPN